MNRLRYIHILITYSLAAVRDLTLKMPLNQISIQNILHNTYKKSVKNSSISLTRDLLQNPGFICVMLHLHGMFCTEKNKQDNGDGSLKKSCLCLLVCCNNSLDYKPLSEHTEAYFQACLPFLINHDVKNLMKSS